MDLAISAVTGDLAGRFISFLVNKFSDHLCSEEKVERLQQLLLRVHTVVEEADGRYITNSCMLIQLKTLSAAMYQGYHVLDNIRNRQHKESCKELVSDSFTLSVYAPLKRSRTTTAGTSSSSSISKAFSSALQNALQNLETTVANMVEFVVLLGGCERISRRPYDAYLHVDNFMFGRHVEKQQILGFLLRHDEPTRRPAVLPVTGCRGVGKKTLVAHVCADERVRSYFASILHLKGDGLSRITDHERLPGRTLVVVEFVSGVDGDDWTEFYSSVRSMGRGSKVIIFGRDEKLEKLGTVKPISVNCLPFEEYRYLFKTLALGSSDPADHPRLAAIVEEFAILVGGSLISANLIAHAMRMKQDAHFWLCKLNNVRIIFKLNMCRFGLHPNGLFTQGRPVHLINGYRLSPGAPSCVVPSTSIPSTVSVKNLPKVRWDFLAEAERVVPPKGDFELTSWESRLPPYTRFVHLVRYVPSCEDDKPDTSLSGKKRPGLSV
ncbi:uncharacterized protein LOC124683636 [Lolium rigidum]|uniref:uncharacterized protein LOC124683636 n=1 Tax=Lolium rigidum TaxID=89674 RepID=UPI001F5C0E6C|nr:uncharacterized protein LOC124683636 [Lolium rigidum]